MRTPRYLLLAGFLAACATATAQKQAWLPITAADLAVSEVPAEPGAPAIQLYYSQHINDREGSDDGESVYRRIKILTEKGIKYADVAIEVPNGFSLGELKARTIHPDGRIVDFDGRIFDKVVAKGKGFKDLAKTFTLPDVTVNCIVEYRYKLNYPAGVLPEHEWVIQHDLYTLKEEFSIESYTGPITGIDGTAILSLYQTLPSNARTRSKGNGFELELENVPAFHEEPNMPPRSAYLYHVTMAYGGRETSSPERFWHAAGMRWNAEAEEFIGNFREIRAAEGEATNGEPDAERRLRKLYARSQKVRNLSYERERTEDEMRREGLKPNQSVVDVLNRGYGDRTEVTRLFVALARAAGFPASILRISDRSQSLFEPKVLYAEQLNTEIALVSLPGREIYLDPGTRFCPFGLLRWPRTSTQALMLDKKGGVFVETPTASYRMAVLTRTADVMLDEAGTLAGEITVEFTGSDALERRLQALDTDDSGRTKMAEDEILEWLPAGAGVRMTASSGWEASDEPLRLRFSINVPNYGSYAGKRLLVARELFQARRGEAFKQQERRFPVYFPYAFEEDDRITIKVPAGYSVESIPQSQNSNIGYAGYTCESRFDAGGFVTERTLKVNGIYFRTDQYLQVKDFFSKVQSGDEQPIVIQGAAAHAQN